MRLLLLPLLFLFYSVSAFSQCSECARTLGDSEKQRMEENHQFLVGYQYASTWVVGKKTASYSYLAGQTWAFELEYSTAERTVDIAKFEIGKIKEDRISLFAQYYLNNSFFVGGGPYYYEYQIDTAGSLRNALNGNLQETWNIAGFGAGFIFGSRWQTDWGLTWGVDWVRLNIPFVSTWKNKQTGEVETVRRQDVDRTFEILEKFPTIAFVGVQIGYTF